jgi:predicted amidohydrolase
MKVSALQHDICWEAPAETMARVAPLVRAAAAAGAELVALTEMYSTGFTMAPERVAEPPGGPSARCLAELAAELGVWMAASIPTADPSRPRPVNRLVLAGPDGEHYEYDKLHPFSFAGEHDHYAGGSELVTVDVAGVRLSPFVCYDLRVADEFWAVAPRTECFLVVANWPASRRHHWRSLLVARAIENQAYVVGVNRVGVDGNGLAYAGDSMIVDPLGETLASASEVETIVMADVDPAVVADVRARFPFMADRRSPDGDARDG